MTRYWFEFDFTDYIGEIPSGVYLGCGVTAYNYSQAMSIIKNKIFNNMELPKISKSIENVDIRELDQGHVIPNMSAPIYIGIWFPIGYQ